MTELDPFDNPEFRAWATDVMENMAPKMQRMERAIRRVTGK